MIAIGSDKKTLYITRGNATQRSFNKLAFIFPIYNFVTEEEENYEFQLTDKITFTVYDKKGYTKEEKFRKEYTISDLGYTEPTTTPEIILTAEDTSVFDVINKRKVYWYDIVLNDETTILGFDNTGGKQFIVYPEFIESEE